MKFSLVQVEFLDFVLQDAADRLHILNRGRDDPQLLENPELSDDLDAKKLENDISITRAILLETLEELKSKGTVKNLTNLFITVQLTEDYEREILETNDSLKLASSSLGAKIHRKTKEIQELTEYLKNNKDELEHQFESMARAGRNNEKTIVRMKAIERAETVAHKQEIVDSAVTGIKKNEEHTETDHFLNEMFIDAFIETRLIQLEEQIEHWSAKYETDMEVNTTKVKDTKDEIENLRRENDEMVVLIAKREKEMEKFLEIKAKRDADEAAERKIYDSTTAIQAWWRGVMVRRKLGPYGKKRKRKKAGKPVKGGGKMIKK